MIIMICTLILTEVYIHLNAPGVLIHSGYTPRSQHTSSLLQATDVDTGDFGTVNYEFADPQSLFSLDAQDGTIRLTQTFNASADDKYNIVPIRVFDNPNNRFQSFSVVSLTRVREKWSL